MSVQLSLHKVRLSEPSVPLLDIFSLSQLRIFPVDNFHKCEK